MERLCNSDFLFSDTPDCQDTLSVLYFWPLFAHSLGAGPT